MKRYLRNSIFIIASILFYLGWMNGGEKFYGKFVTVGINEFITKFSSIEQANYKQLDDGSTMMTLKYPDRTTRIALEYCLPVVLLLAWQLSLFFDKRLTKKYAAKLLAFNFIILYFLQIIFPLLLFNISQSKTKSIGLFIGLQIFGFIVFFIILKDSLLIRLKVGQHVKTNGE